MPIGFVHATLPSGESLASLFPMIWLPPAMKMSSVSRSTASALTSVGLGIDQSRPPLDCVLRESAWARIGMKKDKSVNETTIFFAMRMHASHQNKRQRGTERLM